MKDEFIADIAARIRADKRLGELPPVQIIGVGMQADMARGALKALGCYDDNAENAFSFSANFLPKGVKKAVITAADRQAAARVLKVKPQASVLIVNINDRSLYVTDLLIMAFIVLKKGRQGRIYNEAALECAGFERIVPKADAEALFQGYADNDDEPFVFQDAKSDEFKRLQKTELEILIETDRVCRENGIQYSLAGGTLLGAARHKGFIPWDYDIDIMMSPENFHRFLKLSDKFSGEYFLQTPQTDKKNYFFFKVRKNGTLMTTEMTDKLDIHKGVFIDVFVHNFTAKGKLLQKLHRIATKSVRSLVYNKWNGTPVRGKKGSSLPFIVRAGATVLKTLLPMKLLCRAQFFVTGFFKEDTGFMYDGLGQHLERGAFPSAWFDEYTELEFEGRKFPVIAEYKRYLEYLYGKDHTTLPPVSERHISHDIVRLDLGA